MQELHVDVAMELWIMWLASLPSREGGTEGGRDGHNEDRVRMSYELRWYSKHDVMRSSTGDSKPR